jgi:hypothetical protein
MTSRMLSSTLTSSCSVKLSTLVRKINLVVTNRNNASIILDFQKYMEERGSSENHQVNNLKVVMDFAKYLGPIMFYDIKDREQVVSFLNGKIKSSQEDPDKRWITT